MSAVLTLWPVNSNSNKQISIAPYAIEICLLLLLLLVYVGPIGLGFRVFTSDKVCFCPCMSVYLSVSKITQKCMRGFG